MTEPRFMIAQYEAELADHEPLQALAVRLDEARPRRPITPRQEEQLRRALEAEPPGTETEE